MPSSLRSPLTFALLLVLAFGAWLRLPGEKHRARKGQDEGYYEDYVKRLEHSGLAGWPDLIADYSRRQKDAPLAFLPPTRVFFLASAHGWRVVTGASPLESVRAVACASGIALLLVGAAFAWRLGGPGVALGVGALLACAPLLIHLSHRALIDGFFALWAVIALWGLWESLRAPERRGWLALYATGLAAMVLTKENAAFAFAALCAILVLNRWLKFGRVTREIVAISFLAPALAAGVLIFAAGGLRPLLAAYQINIQKSVVLPYAIATGDGPWHRYLLDFLLISPTLTLLAVAALGGTAWSDPAKRYLVVFLAASYALMAQVRYGMNLRYGAMWELPLCWLAFSLLTALAAKLSARWRSAALALAVALVCGLELRSYHTLFVASDVYDPVAGSLSQVLQMWKPQL